MGRQPVKVSVRKVQLLWLRRCLHPVVKLRFKLKRRQIKMIKRFAQMMKWPNLHETLDTLKRRDTDSTLDGISSHAMAFFSGLVLPGVSTLHSK